MENLHTLFEGNKTYILGHRGCSELFPENTMVSFEDCASDPDVDGVELDVHLCKSGEVVVIHDSSLKRTAGIDKTVEELTWNELEKVDVGSFKGPGFSSARIPLLEELFSSFGNRFVYDIELKVPAGRINRRLCLKVWDLIRQFRLEEAVMVSSFNPFALRRFNRACWYSVPTADIFCESKDVPKAFQHGGGHFWSGSSFLKPDYMQVNAGFIESHGMPVVTWTVNTKDEAERLLGLEGVRGLIGNNPHMLADVLKQRKGV